MDKQRRIDLWHAVQDDEGQVSIFDGRGFVAAVSNRAAADRLVTIHNQQLIAITQRQYYDNWASLINYSLWYQAQGRLNAIRSTSANLFNLVEDSTNFPVWVRQMVRYIFRLSDGATPEQLAKESRQQNGPGESEES